MSNQAATPGPQPGQLNLHMLLKAMVEKNASDLHITAGSPPQLRIDGKLVPLRTNALTPPQTRDLCFSVLNQDQRSRFEQDLELDLSFGVKNLSRFRVNLLYQRGAVSGAFRLIPYGIKTIEDLDVPRALIELSRRESGLILITGPTGSGKSTTLAAIIDLINTERQGHIITIEDPIEYVHTHKSCLVTQREIGVDTHSFQNALKYALRQDPDIVLIGEMRDLETIEAAMTIAETGHLTFGTLHTNGAVQTINRIVDVFPPHQQSQVRAQLSFVLVAVLSQQLIPLVSGGRTLCTELMLANTAIRNLIREDKVHQIQTQLQVGRSKSAMHTMNQSLYELVATRKVKLEEAMLKSPDVEELTKLVQAGGRIAV